MLEALTKEAIKKCLDARMPGFYMYPTQRARHTDSIYILMGYDGKVKIPLCLKVRVGTHRCTHENDGQYYFVSLRTDLSLQYNDGLLMDAVSHIERIVNSKIVEERKRLNRRF